MDIAVVSAGVNLTLDGKGVVNVGPRRAWAPWRRPCCWLQEAAKAIIGSKLDDAALDKLAAACSAACRPIDDKRGTIEFRTEGCGRAGARAPQRSRMHAQEANEWRA